MRRILTFAAGLALSVVCCAHTASTGFVDVQVDDGKIAGSLELAVRDAELAIGVDTDRDGSITWGELRGSQERLIRHLASRITLAASGQPCPLAFGSLMINERVDGLYAYLPFTAQCQGTVSALAIRYAPMAEIDPSHRGLLTFSAAGVGQAAVLGDQEQVLEISPDVTSTLRTAQQYLWSGMIHIWSGIDHLLFLLSLLLPAVLLRQGGKWEPVEQVRPAWVSTVQVVTAFTLAHSITLTLAALDVVHLPSRLTESVIAASIIVVALNNVFPLVTAHRARIAFLFGLLHGFGFASVLSEMGLPSGARLVSLLSFNVGIEVGQLAVVCVAMPVIFALRRRHFYRSGVLPWGSALIAGLAGVWLVQRAWMSAG